MKQEEGQKDDRNGVKQTDEEEMEGEWEERWSLWKEEKKRMEERIAKHKPRSVRTKEKKYTSLHLREAVGKNRK